MREHEDDVGPVAVARDGKTVASGSGDKTVRLWDGSTGKPIQTLPHSTGVSCVAFSPDGKTLATTDGAVVRLWRQAAASTAASGKNK